MSTPIVSVFTPTHDPKHLLETYDSLAAQTFPNFEWVLVPNGDVTIPARILEDERVKVYPFPSSLPPGIGALKEYACRKCQGQLFVELDHDDMLTENALEVIVHMWNKTGADFLYSDFVNFNPDRSSRIFRDDNWEHYPITWRGRSYEAIRAFEPSPNALAWIFYAPNHVRVWHRDIYAKVQGHDSLRTVCDDQDLIIRTYLAQGKFAYIPHPLYFYREHNLGAAGNSYVRFNDQIKAETRILCNKNFHRLVYEWARRLDLQKVQLYSYGTRKTDHHQISIDQFSQQENPLAAFDDNSVSVVWAYDFLPRVPQTRRVWIMNGIYRVLAPGGYLLSRLQSSDGTMADADPSVMSRWNALSFAYYSNRKFAETIPGLTCRFQDTRVWDEYYDKWHADHRMLHTYAELAALKGQRQPGPTFW